MIPDDVLKKIDFNFGGLKLQFDVSSELFSAASVDEGSKLLLNSLRKNEKIKYKKILDLGCGYGVLGIFLKKQNPSAGVVCVDRNSLALDFTKRNAELNNSLVEVFASLDYSAIDEKFDLIVCNFPAKLQGEGLKRFVYGASEHLNAGGVLATVIVKELRASFKKILCDGINVEYEKDFGGYSVYHLSFSKEFDSGEDVYTRGEIDFKVGETIYKMKTVWGLPEFDSPHYISLCLIDLLKKVNEKNIAILNPVQGHVALGVVYFNSPEKLFLISNDLLSLDYCKKNLNGNNFFNIETLHSDLPSEKMGEVLVWSINNKNFEIVNSRFKILLEFYDNFLIGGDRRIVDKLIRVNNLKVEDLVELDKYKAIKIYGK